jgi:hypothetical protein
MRTGFPLFHVLRFEQGHVISESWDEVKICLIVHVIQSYFLLIFNGE